MDTKSLATNSPFKGTARPRVYRNLAGFIAVTLSLALIFQYRHPELKVNLSSIEAVGWVVSYVLAFLWFNNRIMLYGVIFITIYGNLKLRLDPAFIGVEMLAKLEIMEALIMALYLVGLACLTIALWPQFYPSYLTRKINWSPFELIAIVLVTSIAVQALGALS